MTDDEPTPLREAAVQIHEMYKEFRSAGFSRSEALDLLSRVVARGIADASDGEQNPDGD